MEFLNGQDPDIAISLNLLTADPFYGILIEIPFHNHFVEEVPKNGSNLIPFVRSSRETVEDSPDLFRRNVAEKFPLEAARDFATDTPDLAQVGVGSVLLELLIDLPPLGK